MSIKISLNLRELVVLIAQNNKIQHISRMKRKERTRAPLVKISLLVDIGEEIYVIGA